MKIMEDRPPEWVHKLIEVLGTNMVGQDSVHCRVWQHEQSVFDESDPEWHVEVSPTLHEADGDAFLREYNVHLTPILEALKEPDVEADPEAISIFGKFDGHPVHVVVWTQPTDLEDDLFLVNNLPTSLAN